MSNVSSSNIPFVHIHAAVPVQEATPEATPTDPQQHGDVLSSDGSARASAMQQAAPPSPVRQRHGASSQRHAWRAWRLPSISFVHSNPWDVVERGVVYRISEAEGSSASPSSVVSGQSGSAGSAGSAAAGSLHTLPSERSEGEASGSKSRKASTPSRRRAGREEEDSSNSKKQST